MWIWSISIPSERERRVASFIISFLDCISHTYEVPLLSGNLSWHVKFHTEITHQFTFSPKVDMSREKGALPHNFSSWKSSQEETSFSHASRRIHRKMTHILVLGLVW